MRPRTPLSWFPSSTEVPQRTPPNQQDLSQYAGGLLVKPRGPTYTTIGDLGPIIPSIVWYFGAQFPNSCIYGPSGKEGDGPPICCGWKNELA